MNTNDLVKLLPAGYEDACYQKKAITKKNGQLQILLIFCG